MAFDNNSPFHLFVFLEQRREQLLAASEILGGQKARQRTERLFERIHNDGLRSRLARRELLFLLGLLKLGHVGDPAAAETGYHTEIDLFEPMISDLCILTEEYEEVLALCGVTFTQFA